MLPLAICSFNCCTSIIKPLALQKLPDFDNVVTQFYLNFFKFQNLVGGTSPHPQVVLSLDVVSISKRILVLFQPVASLPFFGSDFSICAFSVLRLRLPCSWSAIYCSLNTEIG